MNVERVTFGPEAIPIAKRDLLKTDIKRREEWEYESSYRLRKDIAKRGFGGSTSFKQGALVSLRSKREQHPAMQKRWSCTNPEIRSSGMWRIGMICNQCSRMRCWKT